MKQLSLTVLGILNKEKKRRIENFQKKSNTG